MTSVRRWPRRVLWTFVALVGLVAVSEVVRVEVGRRNVQERWETQRAQHTAKLTRLLDFYCEQQALLSAEPLFRTPPEGEDAGEVLNRWLPWDGSPKLPEAAADSPLRLPISHEQARLELTDWLTKPPTPRSLDFGWMKELRQYGRWSLLPHNPALASERVDWFFAPLPDFVLLQTWTMYRLLAAMRDGDHAEASQEVQHLARLSASSETVLGVAVAAALLKLERRAYDSLRSPPSEWKPLTMEQIDRLSALAIASSAYWSIATPLSVAERARACATPQQLRCAALAESAAVAKLLTAHPPPELSAELAALQKAAGEGACPLAKTLWKRGVVLEDSKAPDPGLGKFSLVPQAYLDPIAARLLLTKTWPSTRRLEELRAKSQSPEAVTGNREGQ